MLEEYKILIKEAHTFEDPVPELVNKYPHMVRELWKYFLDKPHRIEKYPDLYDVYEAMRDYIEDKAD